jgi:hypothetical protein
MDIMRTGQRCHGIDREGVLAEEQRTGLLVPCPLL